MVRKFIVFFMVTTALVANEEAAKISEAMGHLIGKNLQSLGLEIDIDALVKGLSNEASGKASPLNEEECIEAIAALQQESLIKVAEKNLQEANDFLKKNKERKNIVSLEEGKLQYEVLKKGEGEEVHPYNSPLVRLHGRLANGESIGDMEEVISLDDAISGFSKGLLGMKEGEKRTLYIHPDLGYGKEGNLQPNALLIFEVELVKADASFDAHAASEREDNPIILESDLETPEPVLR